MLFHFFYDFTISFFARFLSSWNSCYLTYRLHFLDTTDLKFFLPFFLSSFLSRANWSKRNKPYIKKKRKKKSKRRFCLVKTKKGGKILSPRNFAQRINSLQMCPWAWEMADGLKISVQFRWDFLQEFDHKKRYKSRELFMTVFFLV